MFDHTLFQLLYYNTSGDIRAIITLSDMELFTWDNTMGGNYMMVGMGGVRRLSIKGTDTLWDNL